MKQEKFKSIQQTLQLLRTITGRKQNIHREIPLKSQDQTNLPSKKVIKQNRSHKNINKEAQKKLIDQNRVLNRILTTLQPTMYNFYRNQNQEQFINGRSGSTRLKIYLKQNQRILKTLQMQEESKKKQLSKNMIQIQQKLEKQYFFTVKQYYRDELQIVVSKNRISKQNYKSTQFNEVLITLMDNQLKIYKDLLGKRLFRTIKLFQIQNIQYNSQPFHFIIINFVKDKSKPQQYLYLKFKSLQDQQKWDRILYINYRLKDMKNKQKLFQMQFPYQQQQIKIKQNKKYQVNVGKLISQLSNNLKQTKNQQTAPLQKSPKLTQTISLSKLKLNQKRLQQQRNKFLQESDRVRQPQTPTILITRAISNQQNVQKQNINQSYLNVELIQPTANFEMQQELIGQSPLKQQNLKKTKILYEQKKNQQLLRSIKKSKVAEFTEILSDGLYFEKQNFFMNKKKRLRIHDDYFEYFDEDDYQKAIINGNKKNFISKKVYLKDIQKINRVQKQGRLQILHHQKKLVMKGELNAFCQWLKLKLMQ